jgi:16S rRNA (cytosine1402-N4)-methyltransferase
MDRDHDEFDHTPVMVDRIASLFGPVPPGTVVDATLGGAGHALALLLAHPHLRLLGLDQDADALAAAEVALAPVADRVALRRTRFDRLAEAVADAAAEPVTGVLFDLGVSSPQLDRPERGFSYRHEGPLDMRMDPRTSRTAEEIVNTWSVEDLAGILRRYADERYAGRIARAIVAARPLTTTTQLAEVVRDAIPAPARRRGGHPAKRTFQALRIAVNAELEILPGAIDAAIDALAPGGRIAVLAYHSGEDRIVKDRLHTAASGGCACPPALPCTCGAVPRLRLLKAGAWKADAAEAEHNPRASSARLRAAEKLAGDEAAA